MAVITNDLHQQVFVFESGIPGVPDNKVFFHRPVYFVILVWVVGCVCFSIVQLLKKTRLPSIGKRRMMPFVLSCVMLLYGVLYLLGFQVVRDCFWRYECNVLSLLCGDIRKLYPLSNDTV